MDRIERRFTLRPDDVLAGISTAAKLSQRIFSAAWPGKALLVLVWLALVGFFYQIVALLGERPRPEHALSLVISLVLLVAAVLARSFHAQRAYRRALLSPESWMMAETTVELTPEAYAGHSQQGDWRIPWSALDQVQEDAERFYFVLKPNLLFVMPKSVIGSEQEVQCVRLWSQSKA